MCVVPLRLLLLPESGERFHGKLQPVSVNHAIGLIQEAQRTRVVQASRALFDAQSTMALAFTKEADAAAKRDVERLYALQCGNHGPRAIHSPRPSKYPERVPCAIAPCLLSPLGLNQCASDHRGCCRGYGSTSL